MQSLKTTSSSKTDHRTVSLPRWGWMVVFLAFVTGCFRQPKQDLVGITTKLESKTVADDSVQEGLNDLDKMILFERRVAVAEVTRQLNSWSVRQPADPQWKPSSLVETLPELIARSNWVTNLSKVDFEEPHCDYLFQCRQMRNVSQWVLSQPYRDVLFEQWLEQQKEKLPERDAVRLEQAMKLFDWTVRNVWSDGNPKDIEKLPLNPLLPMIDEGIGYTQLPWHTLIRGRGDFLQRARVFSQLLFQEQIPIGWLVLPGITTDQYKLWIMAVPIGDQIYLFEPRMGIPLPGPGQNGVATLEDARKDPSVLRRAKLVDQFEYPVSQGDLGDLLLVLDVEPFAMSRSMRSLEKSLAGENRMRLFADVEDWLAQYRKVEPKLEVKLWSLPWLTQDYGSNLRSRLKDATPFTFAYFSKMGLYIDDTPVTRARLAHFAGNHGSTVVSDGAFGLYMDLRVDDETLEQLPFSAEVQSSLMVRRWPNEDLEAFQARIRQYQILYRQSKLEGSLFLSMLHFDLGNFETSLSWSDRWMLKVAGTASWHPFCWYLMARNYEQLGKKEEAIELYKKSPSAQEAGNRIRARMLGK